MARARQIKPEFWTSEQIVNCCRDARLLFIGILNFSDDSGVHPAAYKTIKMEVFPADTILDEDIIKWVAELKENDLLVEYEVSGRKYWKVTGWERHQNIQHKYFKHPLPDGKVPIAENTKSKKKSYNNNTGIIPESYQDNTGIVPVLPEKETETEKKIKDCYNKTEPPLIHRTYPQSNNLQALDKRNNLENLGLFGNTYYNSSNSIAAWLFSDEQVDRIITNLHKCSPLPRSSKELVDEIAFSVFLGSYRETRINGSIDKAINSVISTIKKNKNWTLPKDYSQSTAELVCEQLLLEKKQYA